MKMKALLTKCWIFMILCGPVARCQEQLAEKMSLEQRVRRGEREAYKEVIRDHRVDLIPVLEEQASKSTSDDWPRIALGGLGVSKYVDEVVQELVAPTNTAAYVRYGERYRHDPAYAELMTIERACNKLAMMRAKSSVKHLIEMLDYQGDVLKRVKAGRSVVARPQTMAGTALWRMQLENAPTNKPFRVDEDFIKAWKLWWEQNKDKYP
jgi:hypothetical protein